MKELAFYDVVLTISSQVIPPQFKSSQVIQATINTVQPLPTPPDSPNYDATFAAVQSDSQTERCESLQRLSTPRSSVTDVSKTEKLRLATRSREGEQSPEHTWPADESNNDRRLLESQIKQQIADGLKYPNYQSCHFVNLYWKAGDEGFKTEAEYLGKKFRERLGFKCSAFAIPSEKSALELNQFLTNFVREMNTLAKDSGPGLVVIHYGGHGDKNRDVEQPGEQPSVWAE
jgi:hypothetical protein